MCWGIFTRFYDYTLYENKSWWFEICHVDLLSLTLGLFVVVVSSRLFLLFTKLGFSNSLDVTAYHLKEPPRFTRLLCASTRRRGMCMEPTVYVLQGMYVEIWYFLFWLTLFNPFGNICSLKCWFVIFMNNWCFFMVPNNFIETNLQ